MAKTGKKQEGERAKFLKNAMKPQGQLNTENGKDQETQEAHL